MSTGHQPLPVWIDIDVMQRITLDGFKQPSQFIHVVVAADICLLSILKSLMDVGMTMDYGV